MIISATQFPIVAAALETSNTVVAVLDAAAHPFLIGVSGAFLEFSGFTFSEVIGQALDLIAKPGTPSLAGIAAAMRAGQPYRGDLACIAKDGAEKWLGLHLMPVASGTGRHFVLIGRDITAQRREGAQARLIQNVLLKIFMTSEAAIAIVSGDDRIIMANPHMERLLGGAPGAFAGRHLQDLIAAPYRQAVADARAATAVGESCHIDAELHATPNALLPATLGFTCLGGGEMAHVSALFIRPTQAGIPLATRLRMAGKIRFLSLDAVRCEMEDRWTRIGPRVIETAEALIRRRLGPHDTLASTADRGFIICFGDASDAEATALAGAMAHDLLHHLTGQGEAEIASRLTATVSQVAIPAAGAPDMRQIGRHMDAAEDAIHAAAHPHPILVPILNAANGSSAATLIRHPPRSTRAGRIAFPETSLDQTLHGLRLAAGLNSAAWTLADIDFALFLNKAHSDAIEEACINLPVPVRERLYLILSAWPRGTTRSLLQDLLRRVARMCAGFALRIDDLHLPDLDLAATRPGAAILDMARYEGGAAVPQDRLRRITNLLQVYRIRPIALNVATMEIGRDLAKQGIPWITCPAP